MGKILWTYNMLRLTALVFIAAVSAAPLEDSVDVKAAKAEFKAAFDMAEAGEHIQLAPVNNDVQAEPIAQFYMADSADVAAAKVEFKAAFDDAAAGGLAAKQAPAPVHIVAAPVMPVNYAVSPYAAYPYLSHPHTYPYAYHYGAYPYTYGAYTYGYPYTYPVMAAPAE